MTQKVRDCVGERHRHGDGAPSGDRHQSSASRVAAVRQMADSSERRIRAIYDALDSRNAKVGDPSALGDDHH